MKDLPFTLLAALAAQVFCQLFKVIFYSFRDRRFSPKYFVSAGGIPSSHSAFTTALLVSVGLRSGFYSDVFSVAFVLAAIVIYDAYRLRGAVEKHAKLLNRLTSRYHPEEQENLSEMIGHNLTEIATGIAAGGLFAFASFAALSAAGL